MPVRRTNLIDSLGTTGFQRHFLKIYQT